MQNASIQDTFMQNTTEDASSTSSASLISLVEALLFVAEEPVSLDRLAATLMVDESAVERAVEELQQQTASRGIRIQRKGRQVQMVTAPEAAGVIERFLGLDLSSRLSPAALETLAIIAYKQPVTRAEIEAIRGVQSDSVLRSLLTKGLIEEVGRLDQAGRPILYGTTFEFLQYFGLRDLSELPPLDSDFQKHAESPAAEEPIEP